MIYIKCHLEPIIEKLNGCCKVLLVTGPQQMGKTTLRCKLAEGKLLIYKSSQYYRTKQYILTIIANVRK